jgi:DNA-directed RNA polymerase sigma subunit (sigma70/sigma32)
MEIRRYLPVEEAEEVALFHYLNFARKGKLLTLKKEKMLLARSRLGERQATETLVDANQILVVALAETYDDDRLSFMDRIAEGNVALMSACRDHLPRRDGSFRRYCRLKIREAIEFAIAEATGFRNVEEAKETHHPAASIVHDDSSDRSGGRARGERRASELSADDLTETTLDLSRRIP